MHGHKTEAQGRAVNTCFCEVCGGQQHHMLLATREYRAIEWERAALGNFLLLFVSASIHARVMYIPSTVHSAAPWGIQVVSASAPWLDSVCGAETVLSAFGSSSWVSTVSDAHSRWVTNLVNPSLQHSCHFAMMSRYRNPLFCSEPHKFGRVLISFCAHRVLGC